MKDPKILPTPDDNKATDYATDHLHTAGKLSSDKRVFPTVTDLDSLIRHLQVEHNLKDVKRNDVRNGRTPEEILERLTGLHDLVYHHPAVFDEHSHVDSTHTAHIKKVLPRATDVEQLARHLQHQHGYSFEDQREQALDFVHPGLMIGKITWDDDEAEEYDQELNHWDRLTSLPFNELVHTDEFKEWAEHHHNSRHRGLRRLFPENQSHSHYDSDDDDTRMASINWSERYAQDSEQQPYPGVFDLNSLKRHLVQDHLFHPTELSEYGDVLLPDVHEDEHYDHHDFLDHTHQNYPDIEVSDRARNAMVIAGLLAP